MLLMDLPRVVLNERLAYSHPWSEGSFEECLEAGYVCRVGCIREIGKGSDPVVAHAIASLVLDDACLLNLCVSPEYQYQGLGRFMLDSMINELLSLGGEQISLEVRSGNQRAIDLYLAAGFKIVGKRKAYYPANNGREDAEVLQYRVADRHA